MEVIGVVHLPPLPSSPQWNGDLEEVIRRAVRDAKALEIGGVDSILVENYGDYPYRIRVDPLTVAAVTRVTTEVLYSVNVNVGVSLLRNSAPEAIAIALVTGANFVRSNQWCWTSDAPEGLLQPVAREGIEVMRVFGKKVRVIADVRVKHASPISGRSVCDEARDLGGRCMADALAVSGSATGEEADPEEAKLVKRCSGKPVYVASGVTPWNVDKYEEADGVIVGTYFKEGGVTTNPVDVERVRKFVNRVR
ncbi:photosystem I assembly BtpA [Ignicoccus islandicus DSM 13165]|uniref:Photosystem I assembly BtpA n=1 Tax=Ignicoccus islandicus DSM 13165 TaxID=940295 RepID=A0A0U3F1V8_9CREN|nr:BtpA/SgcQ family protein [Ignicoccus islandicus]ALU11541.1 photosystem I assembly BtpA [Ignicoccus islandicus DSM 13165]